MGVSINNREDERRIQEATARNVQGGRRNGRLGEREQGNTQCPSEELRRRMALSRFVPGDGCREASGCRLGQRPCVTRTPLMRTGGRHTELSQLARSCAEHTTACMRRLRELRHISMARHDAFPQYPPSCFYSSLTLIIGLRRLLPLKLVLPS